MNNRKKSQILTDNGIRSNIAREIHYFSMGSLKELLTLKRSKDTENTSHKLGERGELEEPHVAVLRRTGGRRSADGGARRRRASGGASRRVDAARRGSTTACVPTTPSTSLLRFTSDIASSSARAPPSDGRRGGNGEVWVESRGRVGLRRGGRVRGATPEPGTPVARRRHPPRRRPAWLPRVPAAPPPARHCGRPYPASSARPSPSAPPPSSQTRHTAHQRGRTF
jgi:hypothetical protein